MSNTITLRSLDSIAVAEEPVTNRAWYVEPAKPWTAGQQTLYLFMVLHITNATMSLINIELAMTVAMVPLVLLDYALRTCCGIPLSSSVDASMVVAFFMCMTGSGFAIALPAWHFRNNGLACREARVKMLAAARNGACLKELEGNVLGKLRAKRKWLWVGLLASVTPGISFLWISGFLPLQIMVWLNGIF